MEDTRLFAVGRDKLTRKQYTFVQLLLNNKKMSATEAAMRAYNLKDRTVGAQVASENLRKHYISSALVQANDLAEGVMVTTMRDWGNSDKPRKREIALDAAKFVHDKVHGKATQRVEQQTQVVSISINLTGDGEEPPIDL